MTVPPYQSMKTPIPLIHAPRTPPGERLGRPRGEDGPLALRRRAEPLCGVKTSSGTVAFSSGLPHSRLSWLVAGRRERRSHGEGGVLWFVLGHFVAFLVDLVLGTRRGNREKDLQILVLRHQVRLL